MGGEGKSGGGEGGRLVEKEGKEGGEGMEKVGGEWIMNNFGSGVCFFIGATCFFIIVGSLVLIIYFFSIASSGSLYSVRLPCLFVCLFVSFVCLSVCLFTY